MKRLLVVLAVLTTSLAVGATASAEGQTKATVCHDGDDGIELISIADPAVDKHIEHGDALPGDALPEPSGFEWGATYGPDCRPNPNPDPYEAQIVFSPITTYCTGAALGEFRLSGSVTVTGVAFDSWGLVPGLYAPDFDRPFNLLRTGPSGEVSLNTSTWRDDVKLEDLSDSRVAENPCDPADFDFDFDGVPNDQDVCPDEPGPVDNDGCPIPDSDGDGVPDDQDVCPGADDNADSDDDGIADGCDKCPDEPGTGYTGCPLDYSVDLDVLTFCVDPTVGEFGSWYGVVLAYVGGTGSSRGTGFSKWNSYDADTSGSVSRLENPDGSWDSGIVSTTITLYDADGDVVWVDPGETLLLNPCIELNP